jgi:hypothetical protein
MRHLSYISAVAMAAALAGCGDTATTDMGGNPDMTVAAPADMTYIGFPQPAGTIPVNFSVDDSLNKVYAQGDLEWKGSMIYDKTTRKIVLDTKWGGPWAALWDDGPWNTGGHEPAGSTAGDHKWGITVFATPPAAMGSMDNYEYGLNDAPYQTNFGNGWVWKASKNGTFSVANGATMPINAQGQTFLAFGTTDLRLTLDSKNLDKATAWDTSKVGVKGSGWAWGTQTLTDDGTGKYIFTLSGSTGAGKMFNHTGLLNSGDKPEFIFVLGAGSGKEYKDANGAALPTGVTAEVKPSGGSFTVVPVTIASNKNTTITVP